MTEAPSNPVLRAFHSIPPIVRDILIALLVILILMGSLWAFTGQSADQAPLVVVESGSMMHGDPPYGRVGTIDPGDLILVKDVDDDAVRDVVTLYGSRATNPNGRPGEGDRDGYGMGGDVVIYRQDECPGGGTTPIIHRAMTWVEVRQSSAGRLFSYHDATGTWLVDRADVHLPEIRVSHDASFESSGWITKGDNEQTNKPADQAGLCTGALIQPDWLIGKARGEIPWVGLLKFIVQGNNWQPAASDDVCTVWNAVAPCDSFTMLWLTLFVVILIPLGWDLTARLRHRNDDEDGDLGNGDPPAGGIGPGDGAAKPPEVEGLMDPGVTDTDPSAKGSPAREKPRWAKEAEEAGKKDAR